MGKVYEMAFRMKAELGSKYASTFSKATDKIEQMDRELAKLEKESAAAEKEGKKLSGTFQDVGKNAQTAAGAIAKMTGGGILAGIAAIGGAGTALYKFTSASAEAMAQLEASTGATAMEMKEMRAISKELYKEGLGNDYGDLTESLAAARQITMLQGDELEELTKKAIVYRDVFGEDITESVRSADIMSKQFGTSIDEAYNLMAQGAQKGLNRSNELMDSIHEFSPQFAALGFSAEEMFDLFSTGLDGGAWNLNYVADLIKEFDNILKDGGHKPSRDALATLFSPKESEKMLKDISSGALEGADAFEKIVKALAKIKNPIKRQTLGVAVMGTQFEDLGAKVIESFTDVEKQFDEAAKTMDKVWEDKSDTPRRGWQKIGRTINADLIEPIGYKLLPYMDKFSDSIGDFAMRNAPLIASSVTNAIDDVNEYISNNFINNPDFMELDTFGEKAAFMFEMIKDTYDTWWISSGKADFENVAGNIIKTIGDSMVTNAPLIIEAGRTIGSTLGASISKELEASKFGWIFKAVNTASDFATPSWIESLWAGDGKGAAANFFIPGIFDKPSESKNEGHSGSGGSFATVPIEENATGGYIDRPTLSWIGEGKDNEWIIPENNSRRSHDLWTSAGQSMGLLQTPAAPLNVSDRASHGETMNVTFAPVVNVQGGGPGTAADVKNVIDGERQRFERWFKDMMRDERRLSFR